MAALLITDDYFDAVARLDARDKEMGDLAGSSMRDRAKSSAAPKTIAAEALEAAAKRIEDIAARLAQA